MINCDLSASAAKSANSCWRDNGGIAMGIAAKSAALIFA